MEEYSLGIRDELGLGGGWIWIYSEISVCLRGLMGREMEMEREMEKMALFRIWRIRNFLILLVALITRRARGLVV